MKGDTSSRPRGLSAQHSYTQPRIPQTLHCAHIFHIHTHPPSQQVIGNTGSNSTGEALHATEQGFAVGMHAALQINPYYGKTSALGLKAHFAAVLKEGPAIIYNVPGRTGQDIPDEIVQVGIKINI